MNVVPAAPQRIDAVTGITLERDGPVVTVTLNRPSVLNAIDRDMHRALATMWKELWSDQAARVVILTGAGGAFSGGGDLMFVELVDNDSSLRAEVMREAGQIIDELLRFPLPVIVAIEGPAVGLGCSLAMVGDVVIMAEGSYLADPHVSIGLVAGDGGAAVWPLLASPLKVKQLLWTGDRIPAAEAERIGMATKVVPRGEALPEAQRLAARLSRLPARAVQDTKRAVNMHLLRDIAGVLEFGMASEAESVTSSEHRELLSHLLSHGKKVGGN